MENVELVRNLVVVATPLVKAVVDVWLVPKLVFLRKQIGRKNKIEDHFFNNQFEDYLLERYKSYSILNILAFRNQQRLLKDIYLPLTLEIESTTQKQVKYRVLDYDNDFFSYYKRVLIVDTAGMGKSTISKKLFLSAIEKNSGLPVFLELRRLSKNRSIINEICDELKLVNETIDKNFVLDLIRRGDFIFFLDGYDEISSEDKKYVTEDIQRFVNNSAENTFILTSRQDDSLASFGNFQSFSINPLDQEQVFELLSKYDENGELSKSLIVKVKDQYYHGLNEFLTNPLLVSLLFTAYEYKHIIPLKKHIFYRQVYDALFEAHDLSKGDYYQRDKFSKLAIDDFHTILRYVSFFCLKRDKIEFSKDEILHIVEKSKEKCEIIDFKKSDFLKDLVSTVPLFVKEGLYYKWAHKSLFEYFAAQFIYQDTGINRSDLLKSLAKTKYINILDIYSNIDYKSIRNEIVKRQVSDFLEHCKINKNFKEIEVNSIIKRKELLYSQNYLIIQLDGTDGNYTIDFLKNDKLSSKFFQIIENSFPSIFDEYNEFVEGYGVRINSVTNDFSEVNFAIVLDNGSLRRSIYDFIIALANSKKEKFVKKIKREKKLDFKYFNISKDIPFKVTEDPKSPLNQVETFDFVNELISAYYEGDIIFDYQECKKFLEDLNKSSEDNDGDFFTFKAIE